MAEMTAAAMVEWLTADKAFGQDGYSRKQIAALIEQQQQQIEQLQKVGTSGIEMLHFINNPYAAPEVVRHAILEFKEAVQKWQGVE